MTEVPQHTNTHTQYPVIYKLKPELNKFAYYNIKMTDIDNISAWEGLGK